MPVDDPAMIALNTTKREESRAFCSPSDQKIVTPRHTIIVPWVVMSEGIRALTVMKPFTKPSAPRFSGVMKCGCG